PAREVLMLTVAIALAALMMAPAAEPLTASAALDSPTRHVRSATKSIRRLLKTGFQHSPTFASLIARLERSDLLVYIEEVSRLPGALEGRLVILPPAHGQRYVRIQIALRGSNSDSVAVLGHELRHAVEVADAP